MNCSGKNNPNQFCYICGYVVLPQRRAEITFGHSVELDESHRQWNVCCLLLTTTNINR